GQDPPASLADAVAPLPSEVPCEGGQEYEDCGDPCGGTCAELRPPGPCPPGLCVPGCRCPPGLLLALGGHCVPP
ncbi:SSPO protein, partial [Trogon melanurus]|nr:SSPO protein [Trogon melanurus]